jgi:uncharacterized protein YdbL (DUF1318 family)
VRLRALALVLALSAAAVLASPAMAQSADPVLAEARANGLIGEQADGYLGFVPGAQISADLRGRVEQNNIRRRALYTSRAAERDATPNEMAAAVACEVFRTRIALGERYRDQNGQWRQHTAAQPVAIPGFCAD